MINAEFSDGMGVITLKNPERKIIQSIRREVYDSQDYAEGIRAFHEKRQPVFRGE